ncbi:MAG: hypothetical protein ACI8XW_002814, partial [Gammaproteobacteria bacterium]
RALRRTFWFPKPLSLRPPSRNLATKLQCHKIVAVLEQSRIYTLMLCARCILADKKLHRLPGRFGNIQVNRTLRPTFWFPKPLSLRPPSRNLATKLQCHKIAAVLEQSRIGHTFMLCARFILASKKLHRLSEHFVWIYLSRFITYFCNASKLWHYSPHYN